MAAAPLVLLDHVGVTHPGAVAATPQHVSLRVDPGEVVLLLGPSGCGKSSLALTLNGLIPHAHDAELAGTVRIAGRDTREATPAQLSRDVAMVFQDPDAQIVTDTVLDEVAFALENLLLPPAAILGRAEAALRTVGLWHRRDDDPGTLSGGGRQRLAVACALAMRPRLLVLDEPTANLDPAGTADVYAALGRLVAEDPERGILLIEHDLDAALPLATRIVVLDHSGRVALDGVPAEILSEHRERLLTLGVWRPVPPRRRADVPQPHAPPAIVARDLTVTRGRGRERRTLLEGVSLEIPSGSFTAVIGPNGAGKTTLAQALAGVVPPPRGSVRIATPAGPIDPSRARPNEIARHVGFVFQNPEHQFVRHTVRDELGHGLRGSRPDERDDRVDDMLRRFDLTAHAEQHPFRLSGGQKRRLSVGTALIAGTDAPGPGVLVLDEPTFGQDPARAEELLSLLDALRRAGTTVVVVTHDPHLVARFATHVVALAGGRLQAFGPADEVLPQVRELGFWRDAHQDDAPSGHDADAGAARTARATRPAPFERLDPLGLLVAVLPAMIALVFTRDIATPALAIGLCYGVLLVGAPRTRRLAAWLVLVLPAMATAIGVGFSFWSGPEAGPATGLRLTALLALALIPGLSTQGTAFVRSAVAHLNVPYRIGHTALAAYRFVPRFRHELRVIRAAHRARGRGGALPGTLATAVPLLAGAIRHAERVALAMEARAFGAFAHRTERSAPRWRARDTVTVGAGWAATVGLFAAGLLLF